MTSILCKIFSKIKGKTISDDVSGDDCNDNTFSKLTEKLISGDVSGGHCNENTLRIIFMLTPAREKTRWRDVESDEIPLVDDKAFDAGIKSIESKIETGPVIPTPIELSLNRAKATDETARFITYEVSFSDTLTKIAGYPLNRYAGNIRIISIDMPETVTDIENTNGYLNNAKVLMCGRSVGPMLVMGEKFVSLTADFDYSKREIKIPEHLTEIGDYALANMPDTGEFFKVRLPGSLKKIGSYAFKELKAHPVKLPWRLEYISDFAFCDFKTHDWDVKLPSVKYIGKRAFALNDPGLYPCVNKIRIGYGLRHLADDAFRGTIVYSIMRGKCITSGGRMMIWDNKLMKCVSTDMPQYVWWKYYKDSLAIPEGVTKICKGAIKGISCSSKIILPSTLRHIESNGIVFYGTSVYELFIPDGFCDIDECALIGNFKLRGNVQYVDGFPAIIRNGTLKYIFIDKSCDILHIPEGVTRIGECAMTLDQNTYVKSVSLPKSLRSIGYHGVKSRKWIFSDWESFLNTRLENSCDERKLVIGGKAIEGVLEIPDGVTKIGAYLFSGCTEIKELIIPESLKYIGKMAFYYTVFSGFYDDDDDDDDEDYGNHHIMMVDIHCDISTFEDFFDTFNDYRSRIRISPKYIENYRAAIRDSKSYLKVGEITNKNTQ